MLEDIFDRVEEIVLEFKGVKRKESTNQVTYKDRYQSVLHLRVDTEKVTIAFARGAQLKEKYSFLEGDGVVVRHWYIYNRSNLDEGLLKEIIKETMILNMENYELKKLKCNSKKLKGKS